MECRISDERGEGRARNPLRGWATDVFQFAFSCGLAPISLGLDEVEIEPRGLGARE
jgi:hypothetical protein